MEEVALKQEMDERGGTSKVREQHSVENGGKLKEKDIWSQILEILVGTDEDCGYLGIRHNH